MQNQKILILNFGGQYDQLIARRVRECNVYCEVKPYTMTLSEIQAFDPLGIIFTGGPDSVYKENSCISFGRYGYGSRKRKRQRVWENTYFL